MHTDRNLIQSKKIIETVLKSISIITYVYIFLYSVKGFQRLSWVIITENVDIAFFIYFLSWQKIFVLSDDIYVATHALPP